MKQKITETPLLVYFDPDKELVLQVDSSKDGLGAALLQDGKPIEYVSITSTNKGKKELGANREGDFSGSVWSRAL